VHAETACGQQLLRSINRMALVRQLCAQPGMSRAELAAAVGLTKSTVSLLVRDLLAEGWLMERDVVITGDMGRRPTPLFIDPQRLLLIGAELGVDYMRIVATSLTGAVQASYTAACAPGQPADARIASLAAALLTLQQRTSRDQQVLGIGIGLPGGVSISGGVVLFAPNLGWRDIPFAALLTAALAGTSLASLPLFVQNEADAAALGELEFNPMPDTDPLLYVSINQGLGAGVIVRDRLLTGRRGYAGEVGHMVLQFDGPPCSCGRRGCAEALIATRATLHGTGDAAVQLSIPDVKAQLTRQNPEVVQAVSSAGHHLGMLLLNLATAYDPACIVLGGSVMELGDAFVQPALDALDAYTTAGSSPKPAIRTSRFGADAVAIGAAALVRYRLTRPGLSTRQGQILPPKMEIH
jgi:predicted NBD/HSP70 family sugar kinase